MPQRGTVARIESHEVISGISREHDSACRAEHACAHRSEQTLPRLERALPGNLAGAVVDRLEHAAQRDLATSCDPTEAHRPARVFFGVVKESVTLQVTNIEQPGLGAEGRWRPVCPP